MMTRPAMMNTMQMNTMQMNVPNASQGSSSAWGSASGDSSAMGSSTNTMGGTSATSSSNTSMGSSAVASSSTTDQADTTESLEWVSPAATEWNSTNGSAEAGNAGVGAWNAGDNTQEDSVEWNNTEWDNQWNTTDDSEELPIQLPPALPIFNSSRVCFDAFAPSGPRAETACSSGRSTPPPIPREWLLMNNLKPENANTCSLFRPATGSAAFDCVQQDR